MSDTLPLPLGTYTATLRIINNDSVAGVQNVTVIMHIVEAYVLPEASFTATKVKVGEPTVFTNTTVAGVPPVTTFEWNFGDGTPPVVVGTWDPISHVYATFGRFTVSLKACNDFGCTTFTKDVDVLPNVILLPLVNKN
jgi:PKD repeat protein